LCDSVANVPQHQAQKIHTAAPPLRRSRRMRDGVVSGTPSCVRGVDGVNGEAPVQWCSTVCFRRSRH
jgi:hypothetical protein